jgi:hypothetical protein
MSGMMFFNPDSLVLGNEVLTLVLQGNRHLSGIVGLKFLRVRFDSRGPERLSGRWRKVSRGVSRTTLKRFKSPTGLAGGSVKFRLQSGIRHAKGYTFSAGLETIRRWLHSVASSVQSFDIAT